MKAFVTGGSGFLGRNLIEALVKEGYTVHAIARSEGAEEAVKKVGAKAFRADLKDFEGMKAAAEGCEHAFHCAASVDSFGDLATSREINVEGSRQCARACAAAGVKRFVHVGTEAACIPKNGSPLHFIDETVPLPDPPFPGVYSTSKNEAERAVLAENGKDGMEVVVIRPRFIWGKDDSVCLPGFLEATRSGQLKWFSGGMYLTSTVHVDNVCEGAILAAQKGRAGESYFLTDGEPVPFKVFISRMLRAARVEPPTSTLPLSVVWAVAALQECFGKLTGKKPLVTRQVLVLMGQEVTVNDAKARAELGYKAKVSIDEGMADLERRYQAA